MANSYFKSYLNKAIVGKRRSISKFNDNVNNWQNLPAIEPDYFTINGKITILSVLNKSNVLLNTPKIREG
jgi:hypothetical protein